MLNPGGIGVAHKIKNTMSKEQFAFQLGWSQVKNRDIQKVKKELMQKLGLSSRMAFLNRVKGVVEPKVSEAKAIEETFAKYGIKEVWGVV